MLDLIITVFDEFYIETWFEIKLFQKQQNSRKEHNRVPFTEEEVETNFEIKGRLAFFNICTQYLEFSDKISTKIIFKNIIYIYFQYISP